MSSVLSVWLKRAMGLAPWNSRMLGTATVPNLVERLVEDRTRHDTRMTTDNSVLNICSEKVSTMVEKGVDSSLWCVFAAVVSSDAALFATIHRHEIHT